MPEGRPQLDLSASGRFSGAVQIRDVRLRSSFFSADDVDIDTGGFHTEYFAEVKDLTPDTLTVGVGFRLADHRSGHEDADDDADASELSGFGDYDITYDILGEVDPADAVSFAWINGVMNAWSYWRQLAHSMLLTMGLPAVIVPVFRVETEALGRSPVDRAAATDGPPREPRPPASDAAAKEARPRTSAKKTTGTTGAKRGPAKRTAASAVTQNPARKAAATGTPTKKAPSKKAAAKKAGPSQP
jgi:hypothetical protein